MDQRSSIAAVVKQAVEDTLRHGKPTTLTFDMRTGLWTAKIDRPRTRSGFIRRYLAGDGRPTS